MNIERFLDGQRFGYECALAEIRNGHKENHWIWYVFPHLRGLGHSPNSEYYGIIDLKEAGDVFAQVLDEFFGGRRDEKMMGWQNNGENL